MTGNGEVGESRPRRAGRTATTRDGSSKGTADRPTGSSRRASSGASADTVGARGVLTAARELASELGWNWEALSGLRREGDGWTVAMDVVETRRVPSTTDVIAVYELDVDDTGELLGYRRLRHYVRGRGDNEQNP
ncbi:gas vesicle protein GvpO [Actinomycetospora rhizophila]|uniref:Gas vesicle protein GvpO n=1 Tax=Actinomycetospora rhizophila TaxID=1416876 RepID=A0ABV9ZAU8_9PSEU